MVWKCNGKQEHPPPPQVTTEKPVSPREVQHPRPSHEEKPYARTCKLQRGVACRPPKAQPLLWLEVNHTKRCSRRRTTLWALPTSPPTSVTHKVGNRPKRPSRLQLHPFVMSGKAWVGPQPGGLLPSELMAPPPSRLGSGVGLFGIPATLSVCGG